MVGEHPEVADSGELSLCLGKDRVKESDGGVLVGLSQGGIGDALCLTWIELGDDGWVLADWAANRGLGFTLLGIEDDQQHRTGTSTVTPFPERPDVADVRSLVGIRGNDLEAELAMPEEETAGREASSAALGKLPRETVLPCIEKLRLKHGPRV